MANIYQTTVGGGAYGGVPAPVDPATAQAQSIGGNLANVNNIYALATSTGKASGAGGLSNLGAALPGAPAALGSELALGQSNLAGNIDPGTINNLEQVAAERGVSTGSIGSPNDTAALMQALGRTTQQTEALGGQQIQSAIGQAPMGPQFNPATQQLDPNAVIGLDQSNNELAAAPNPSAAAAENLKNLLAGRNSSAGGAAGGLPGLNLDPGTAGGTVSDTGGYGPTGYGPNMVATGSGLPGGYGQVGGGTLGDIPGSGQSGPPGTIPNGDGTFTDPASGQTVDANGYVIGGFGGDAGSPDPSSGAGAFSYYGGGTPVPSSGASAFGYY